jgi:hypothetical protein
MSTTPRTGQPRTAAAVRDVAFPAGRGGPEARYMASPASHRITRARESEVPRVSWTPEADSDLQLVVNDAAVRDQLKRNAEATLHEIEASVGEDRRAEGFEGEVMWHRGWTHEQERRASWHPEQADDGPWNYVLFYRSAVVPARFVVLAVRSRIQIADRIWERLQNGVNLPLQSRVGPHGGRSVARRGASAQDPAPRSTPFFRRGRRAHPPRGRGLPGAAG